MLKIHSFHPVRQFLATTVLGVISVIAAVTSAHAATTITFDDGSVAAGATLGTQYASQGVTFTAGGGAVSGVINPASTTQGFATNTDLSIDALESGAAAPLSGLVLRSLNGWASETGDPVFTMTFASAITALSMDFGSVSGSAGQAAIFAVNPATGIATTVGFEPATLNGTTTAVNIPAGAKTFVVVPGNYNDYVAVDNIVFTAVPEPSTVAAAVLGLGALGLAIRRQRRAATV